MTTAAMTIRDVQGDEHTIARTAILDILVPGLLGPNAGSPCTVLLPGRISVLVARDVGVSLRDWFQKE